MRLLVLCRWHSVYTYFFFFKQKTAYEMRISDWSSDVCSSDLRDGAASGLRAWGLRCAPSSVVFLSAVFRAAPRIAQPPEHPLTPAQTAQRQIGRASCRERVCQYV